MKIAIDARWIFKEISGIGAYTRELIRNLAVIDKENEYILIFHDPDVMKRTVDETDISLNTNFQTKLVPANVLSVWNQLLMPGFLKSLKADIFHSTNYMIPFLAFPGNKKSQTACITTIHDVIPLLFPGHAPKSVKSRFFALYKWIMMQVGKRADVIITDSKASASDIKHELAIDQSSCTVKTVYCGVSSAFKAPDKRASSGNKPRILYVGRMDPYKNVCGLIKIFARLRTFHKLDARLCIAGSPDPRYTEAPDLARDLNVDEHIEWTGYLSDAELLDLYQSCDLLIHPSEYEGFGLQVLEAMSCGMPVVCSNAGSLPEVAGNAALLHHPHDIEGFAFSAYKILTDPKLSAKLSKDGLLRSKLFTWRNTAEETLKIYQGSVKGMKK